MFKCEFQKSCHFANFFFARFHHRKLYECHQRLGIFFHHPQSNEPLYAPIIKSIGFYWECECILNWHFDTVDTFTVLLLWAAFTSRALCQLQRDASRFLIRGKCSCWGCGYERAFAQIKKPYSQMGKWAPCNGKRWKSARGKSLNFH